MSISGTVQIVTIPACVAQSSVWWVSFPRVLVSGSISGTVQNTRVCSAGTNSRDWQSCAKSRGSLNSLNRSSAADPSTVTSLMVRTRNVCTDSHGSLRFGDVKNIPPELYHLRSTGFPYGHGHQTQRMAPTQNTRVCGSTIDFGGGGVNSVSSTHLSCNGMNLSRS